jgi:hypothetical protein
MSGAHPQMDASVSARHPASHASSNPVVAASIVVAMLVMVIVPAAITLHSVRSPGKLVFEDGNQNPSPYGYTISLLLFIVPIVVIAFWFLPSEGLEIPQRAFWRTVGVLVPSGFALDYIFAQWFFSFPKPGATLGIHAWALGKPVPVEEYVF